VPVRDELIAAIDRIVAKAAAAGYSSAAATSDIYENYIWALCLKAARQHGASIKYEDINEQRTSTLIFRTSPGAIVRPGLTLPTRTSASPAR